MKYKLLWPKRAEKGMVLEAGAETDLSHYTKEERELLVKQGQYEPVGQPATKAVKNG